MARQRWASGCDEEEPASSAGGEVLCRKRTEACGLGWEGLRREGVGDGPEFCLTKADR